MSAWVISLLGIVVITLVCDVILPQGQTAKYVKTVISVIVVCAIVFPLVDMTMDLNFDDLWSESLPAYQQSYLDYVKEEKAVALANTCDKLLAENGIKGCKTVVTLNDDLLATSVSVTVEQLYYNQATVEKITKTVVSVISIDKSEVHCIVKD